MSFLDIIVVILCAASAFIGYKQGFIRFISNALAVVVSLFFVRSLVTFVQPFTDKIEAVPPMLTSSVAYIVSFAIIFIVVKIICHLAEKLGSIFIINTLNKVGGAIACLIICVFCLSFVLFAGKHLDKNQVIVTNEMEAKSFTFEPLVSFMDYLIIKTESERKAISNFVLNPNNQ